MLSSKSFIKLLIIYYAFNYINEKIYNILGLNYDMYNQLNGRMFMALFIMCGLVIINNDI